MIIYRQKGNKIWPGDNVGQGNDFTLFATKDGIVKYTQFGSGKTKASIIPSTTVIKK
jgi:large subunit ribosomal protein L27